MFYNNSCNALCHLIGITVVKVHIRISYRLFTTLLQVVDWIGMWYLSVVFYTSHIDPVNILLQVVYTLVPRTNFSLCTVLIQFIVREFEYFSA